MLRARKRRESSQRSTSRRHSSRAPQAVCVVLLLLAAVVPSPASQVRLLNLEEMTARAGHIVYGRVIAVRSEKDPDLGRIVTSTTLEVERRLKGTSRGRLTFRTLGGPPAVPRQPGSRAPGGISSSPRAGAVRGMPVFQPGERVLVFLYPESRLGLTSPVGFGQGKFTVAPDPKKGQVAMNAFGNRSLLEGISEEALRRMGGIPGRGESAGPVPLDVLIHRIGVLVDGPGKGGARDGSGDSAPAAGGRVSP